MSVNKIICGDWIEVLKTLPDSLVHCCITSPPYWGQRNYGVDGQLGLEKTPEEHIEKLVLGFRELRRVLRDDGVVFLNYGDKYASTSASYHGGWDGDSYYKKGTRNRAFGQYTGPPSAVSGLKQGDLIGLAWRLALALQADGWYLRSDIIWAKALSFCEKYSGSTMPESVNGWRWERHKIKVGKTCYAETGNIIPTGWREPNGKKTGEGDYKREVNKWQDCPGCAKCEPDGLILRKGSWRPTRAHEYLFQLAKSSSYYCDMEAVREELSEPNDNRPGRTAYAPGQEGIVCGSGQGRLNQFSNPSGRNLRDVFCPPDKQFEILVKENGKPIFGAGGKLPEGMVEQIYNILAHYQEDENIKDVFCINPQAYPDSHYATFPEKLVEPCIKVGTSQKGCCPKCGAQWARIVDTRQYKPTIVKEGERNVDNSRGDKTRKLSGKEYNLQKDTTTLGWLPTCKHKEEPVPCIVYDPFMGSGTVAAVAAKLGRNYLGSELNEDYVKNQAEYRVAEGETGISKDEQRAGQMALEFE